MFLLFFLVADCDGVDFVSQISARLSQQFLRVFRGAENILLVSLDLSSFLDVLFDVLPRVGTVWVDSEVIVFDLCLEVLSRLVVRYHPGMVLALTEHVGGFTVIAGRDLDSILLLSKLLLVSIALLGIVILFDTCPLVRPEAYLLVILWLMSCYSVC